MLHCNVMFFYNTVCAILYVTLVAVQHAHTAGINAKGKIYSIGSN